MQYIIQSLILKCIIYFTQGQKLKLKSIQLHSCNKIILSAPVSMETILTEGGFFCSFFLSLKAARKVVLCRSPVEDSGRYFQINMAKIAAVQKSVLLLNLKLQNGFFPTLKFLNSNICLLKISFSSFLQTSSSYMFCLLRFDNDSPLWTLKHGQQ